MNHSKQKKGELTYGQNHLSDTYINFLKSSLLNQIYIEAEAKLIYTFGSMLNKQDLAFNDFFGKPSVKMPHIWNIVKSVKLNGEGVRLYENDSKRYASELRNITELSHTMVGEKRLDNIRLCIETVLQENVKGDFVETGIWRGGACIFMRGILKAYDVKDRIVWAADSFDGVPAPSLPQDADFDISKSNVPVLAVPIDEVKELFQRYGLLDSQVQFLEGWFKDTLGNAPIDKISVLRLDGDLYESTMDALNPLYEKVQSRGFVIVDDYGTCPPCKAAVNDFRKQNNIADPLIEIDQQSVYWRKT